MTLQEYKDKYQEDRFFKEVFIHEIYGPVLKEKCDTVLDVGALAGEFSIWIKDRAKVIYAFEPDHTQFQELKENVADFPNINPFELALWNSDGEANLAPSRDRRGGFRVDPNELGENIQVKTLATFMKEHNIGQVDILKIDIEGGEEQVFTSLDFKDVAGQINYIIGEHIEGDLIELLKSYGFTTESYQHGRIFKRT